MTSNIALRSFFPSFCQNYKQKEMLQFVQFINIGEIVFFPKLLPAAGVIANYGSLSVRLSSTQKGFLLESSSVTGTTMKETILRRRIVSISLFCLYGLPLRWTKLFTVTFGSINNSFCIAINIYICLNE